MTFDTEVGTNWHYDYLSEPAFNENDFLSTALHELVHAFGFGTSDEWSNLVSGGYFTGPNAVAEFGSIILLNGGHWASGTESVILGTNISQTAALEASSQRGTRQQITSLDAAALDDIGWDIQVPVVYAAADFDTDGDVDGNDLNILETWYGPYTNGDADGDGDTDGTDALIWQRQYTGPINPLTANVPEPTSMVLVGAWLVTAAMRRPRR